MKKFKSKTIKKINQKMFFDRGFALLVSIVTTSILLLISFVIVNIALKQLIISNVYKSSQIAFYAADSGMDCAIFWDLKNQNNLAISAFDPNTSGLITCNGQTVTSGSQVVNTNPSRTSVIGGTGVNSVLTQTVSENSTASLSCGSGKILSYESLYGTGSGGGGGSCPISCGFCTIGASSCSVTYNDANCGDCNYGYAKNGDLSVTCSNGNSVSSSIFQINYDNACAIVSVIKNSDGTTKIDSHGYNTCDTSSLKRYERGITITY